MIEVNDTVYITPKNQKGKEAQKKWGLHHGIHIIEEISKRLNAFLVRDNFFWFKIEDFLFEGEPK